jgi:hypothetical protein
MTMPSRGEIKSEKILVKDIFSTMWFRIPEYQRPYLWGQEQISELLGDLTFAMAGKPDFEYFLGSFVFQSKKAAPDKGQEFEENDLLDGQQRMATLLLLFAVIRDLAQNLKAKAECQGCIYQEARPYRKVPERTRLFFPTREGVQKFIDEFIKVEGGTEREDALTNKLGEKNGDLSTQNLAMAVLQIHKFFRDNRCTKPEDLLDFLLNKVLLVYISTEELEDAFRLFTILNDRGLPLRNSDILKSMNLGALDNPEEKVRYAKMWEAAEGDLGADEFDRFLNHVRTILLKDKARQSLLQEFEDKIYEPKERDKATGQMKLALLSKGRATFLLIERYLEHYQTLRGGHNYNETGRSFKFDNLIQVLRTGLPASEWEPPVLRYFDRFGYNRLVDFLTRLGNKFSADWICQYTPTDRIEAMNKVLMAIDDAQTVDDVFGPGCFEIDRESFARVIGGGIYDRRFARYVLLMLDYLFHNHDHQMHFETLSVEHVLPQNPADNSQWVRDFTPEERAEWTDKLGNLVLITRRKNSSQGRSDYAEKKRRYFDKCIDSCANSLRVLDNEKWTPVELKRNHELVVSRLLDHYRINGVSRSATA